MPQLLLMLMGVSLLLAVHNIWVWLGRRSESMYLWVGLWSLMSLVYQWTRYKQLTANSHSVLFVVDRIAFTAAIFVAIVLILMVRELTGVRRWTLVPKLLLGIGLAALALHWSTEVFVTRELDSFVNLFGHLVEFTAVGPGYMPFLVIFSGIAFIYCVGIIRNTSKLEPGVRWVVVGGLSAYVVLGAHDILLYSGFFDTISLFEYGFASMAVGLNVLLVRQIHTLQSNLEDQVAARTSELVDAVKSARDATQAKSHFLANMSHELRTPLNGIIGMLELALSGEKQPERREYLNVAMVSAEALVSLIGDILDVSKIEAGKLELNLRPFCIREWLADTIRMTSIAAHEKQLELFWDVDERVPPFLTGDHERLRQIVINLLSNAIKFTSAGGVSVVVELVEGDDRDQSSFERVALHFSIVDSGVGIPAQYHASIFEIFSQVDSSSTRRYGGAGLGLAISRQLVEMMNGEIWIESEIDQGSAFHFTCALEQIDDESLKVEGWPQGLHVLLCDGRKRGREMFAEQLRHKGWKVDLATDIDQALVLISEANGSGEAYDLHVIEISTLRNSGAERLDEGLRAGRDRQKRVIVVASVTDSARHHFRRRGWEIITSPIKLGDFLRLTNSILGNSEEGDAEKQFPSDRVRYRVLVADDNSSNCVVAEGLLHSLGHDVMAVANGDEVLSVMKNRNFDIIFMDVQMPFLDGPETTCAIREMYGNEERPWIVAVTAAAAQEDRERCFASGMNDFLAKPITLSGLEGAIQRYFQRTPQSPERGNTLLLKEQRIDTEILAELGAIDPDGGAQFVARIIDAFQRSSQACLLSIDEACDRGDDEALARAAHRFKGASLQVGAMRLAALCNQLDRIVSGRESGDSEALIEAIHIEYPMLLKALNNIFR